MLRRSSDKNSQGSAKRGGGGEASRSSAHAELRKLAGAGYEAQAAAVAPAPTEGAKGPGAGGGGTPAISGLDSSSFERWAQSGLNALGRAHGFMKAEIAVDGVVGRETRGATRAFQRASQQVTGVKLSVDGIIGKNTKRALEAGTSSSAPSVRERSRREAAAPPPKVAAVGSDVAGLGAAAGGSAAAAADTGKTGASATTKATTKANKGSEGPVEERVDAKKKQEANTPKPTPKPGQKRSGDAGKADEIRSRFPDGILVSLSVPAAYDSLEEVLKVIKSPKDISAYAYRARLARWAKGVGAGPFQAAWEAVRGKKSKLPKSYAKATKRQQARIRAKVKKSGERAKVKASMCSTYKEVLAKTMLGNNKHIPRSAAGYAKAQRAVAGQGGVKLGKSMVYHKADEIGSLTTATSEAVAALLAANPPVDAAPNQAELDKKTALVRLLTVSAHGWPNGMGGHGKAAAARLHKSQVRGIIAAAAGSLAPDVRVRLFACHTARVKGKSQRGEDTIADEFREALHEQGKTKGAVIGHRESGETQTNWTTRFFATKGQSGYEDWMAKDLFGKAYAKSFLASRGFVTTGKAGGRNIRILMKAQVAFFGREGWMEDISSKQALQKGVRARWEKKYPDGAALKAAFKKLKKSRSAQW